jgi:plastocyanin
MAASAPRAPQTAPVRRVGTLELYAQETSRGWTRWIKRGLLALGVFAFLGVTSLALLVYADIAMAGDGSRDFGEQAQWAWAHGDHLHYAGHLVAARLFDVCPCTRRTAAAHYYYARFHAVTQRQKDVLVNARPASAAEWAAYVTGPIAVGLDWLGDGVAWLGGHRPPRQVVVVLDKFAVQPEEIHIPRGTSVTWLNADQLGEAHTVTADAGQLVRFDSDWLEPYERFDFVFTERGRFIYFCRAHGAPQLGGMSGVVVVE